MKFNVMYTKTYLDHLNKLDPAAKRIITGWVNKNILSTENPRLFGKPLTGNLKGYWRYRIGDYRIIAEIKDKELVIIAIDVGHRRDIYKDNWFRNPERIATFLTGVQ